MVRYAAPIKGLDWKENDPTIIYIVNIKTGNVTTLKTDNIFTMHHINAFEKGKEIIVDISSYPNPNFVKNLEVNILRDPIKRNSFDAHAYVRTKSRIINFHYRTVNIAIILASVIFVYGRQV
jgi:carotenoid cleavage dioxygenase-like enzyme